MGADTTASRARFAVRIRAQELPLHAGRIGDLRFRSNQDGIIPGSQQLKDSTW